MHKIQQVKYTILSAIAISAILIASTAVAGMQSSQQAFAQNTTGATTQNQTNTTGATTQNQTSGAGSQSLQKSPASAAEPPGNKNFVWQGTVSSSPSKLPGHEEEKVAIILPPRKDSGVYSGILTFHASKPVRVVVWNVANPGNTTAIPESIRKGRCC